MKSYHKDADKTILLITRAYEKAIEDIEEEIRKIYDKFKFDTRLSDAEIRGLLNSRVNKKELDKLREKLSTIEDPDIRKQALAKLNAPAYRARITRLEALKLNIYVEVKKLADIELKHSKSLYIDTIKRAYYQHIFDIQKGLGIGFNVSSIPTHVIEEILKNPWSGKNFSERIWKNTDIVADKVTEIMLSGFMSGKSIDKMSRELSEFADTSKYVAARLIRTELTYMANQGELQSYKELGIEKYIYVATLDDRTSEICRKLDRKVFEVEKAKVGENYPPMHPNCRSTTRAYLGPDTLKGIQRRARDPKTGKTYLIPADMSYEEWYQKHVVNKYGPDQAEIIEKKVKNKANDREQYERYKNVLGDDLGIKSLEEFQELKYNNIEKYNLIKLDYSRRKKLIDNPELKLPNVDKVTIDDRKFTEYLFGGNNKNGLIKGELITKKLGYNIDNYKEFKNEIMTRVTMYPSSLKSTTKYGQRYEVKLFLYSKDGVPVNVETGWLANGEKTHLTSVYITEVKKNED